MSLKILLEFLFQSLLHVFQHSDINIIQEKHISCIKVAWLVVSSMKKLELRANQISRKLYKNCNNNDNNLKELAFSRIAGSIW